MVLFYNTTSRQSWSMVPVTSLLVFYSFLLFAFAYFFYTVLFIPSCARQWECLECCFVSCNIKHTSERLNNGMPSLLYLQSQRQRESQGWFDPVINLYYRNIFFVSFWSTFYGVSFLYLRSQSSHWSCWSYPPQFHAPLAITLYVTCTFWIILTHIIGFTSQLMCTPVWPIKWVELVPRNILLPSQTLPESFILQFTSWNV